jgi:preprotein translocase subunit SecB
LELEYNFKESDSNKYIDVVLSIAVNADAGGTIIFLINEVSTEFIFKEIFIFALSNCVLVITSVLILYIL